MLKAVFFDFDGTVVKFMFNAQKALTEIIDVYAKSGLPQNLLTPDLRISEILNKVEEYLNANPSKGDKERAEAFREKTLQVIEKYEMESAISTTLIDGVAAVLEELKEKGLKLVVITNNSEKPMRHALQKVGLNGFFDLVLTRGSTQFIKPSPQPIQEALKRLKIHPSEAAFVGDSPIDVRAAHEAGVLAIGITTGVSDEKVLKTNGAEHVVSSMKELVPIIMGHRLVS